MRNKPRTKRNPKARKDVYARVTDRIVADLEKGVRPWIQPWSADHLDGRILRPLRFNGEPYAGINVLMLWSASVEHGYDSPTWMTYKQAVQLGGQVRKGEKGSLVVYANRLKVKEETEDGEEREREVPYMKAYTAFNAAAQIDGLPENYYAKPEPRFPDPVERIDHAERFFEATGAEVRYGGNRAYYATASDHIQMPPIETFRDAESFYCTLSHEATHWVGGPERLDREFGKRFGSESYAKEELIAELGAAFLCADLEITPEVRADHASYLSTWLRVLKQDKRAIFAAAAHAQRAVDYLHKLQSPKPPKEKRTDQAVGPCPLFVKTASASSGVEAV